MFGAPQISKSQIALGSSLYAMKVIYDKSKHVFGLKTEEVSAIMDSSKFLDFLKVCVM